MSETSSRNAPRRVALVTGAADGLGREFATALARRGYRVAGLDLADMSGTAELIGDGFHPVRADVADAEEVDFAVEEAATRFGGLHVVVNNAGVHPPLDFERTTLEDWRRIMRVNLDGPFLVSRAALPHLKAAGWGRVVNIASSAAFVGPPDLVAYTTSKAGLVGFTRALSSAVGGYGITVNAIAPSLTRTDEPGDLVSTLLYVCDEGSGSLTGQTINVDGGRAGTGR
ncbi:SDR family oxidoreductase [Actinomadura meridiana]